MGQSGKRRQTAQKPTRASSPSTRRTGKTHSFDLQGKPRPSRVPGANAAASGKAHSPSSGSRKKTATAQTSVDPRALSLCPLAGQCGGCSQLGVPYDEQLTAKDKAIAALFKDIAPADCRIEPILGMDDPFGYRYKIASPFAPARVPKVAAAATRKGKGIPRDSIACGLFATGTHTIIPVPSCPIEHPVGRRIIAAVRDTMARYGVEPYDEDRQTGFVRYVVVRVGQGSDEVLVTLVTARTEFPGAKNFARELVKRCPEITTVVQNVNPRVTNAILGTDEHTLYGPGFIIDRLCGMGFRISSRSFYQVNARQTEALYNLAMDLADIGNLPAPTVVDAYCGTGTIGLVAASRNTAAQVIGVDKVASAIEDAQGNAAHNGIGNAEFAAEDAGSFMRRMAAEGRSADVLFLDPPRAGATTEFLDAAIAIAPERIVYISCNPETQARDATYLAQSAYLIERLCPVDMFPHTHHVECVALLTREAL